MALPLTPPGKPSSVLDQSLQQLANSLTCNSPSGRLGLAALELALAHSLMCSPQPMMQPAMQRAAQPAAQPTGCGATQCPPQSATQLAAQHSVQPPAQAVAQPAAQDVVQPSTQHPTSHSAVQPDTRFELTMTQKPLHHMRSHSPLAGKSSGKSQPLSSPAICLAATRKAHLAGQSAEEPSWEKTTHPPPRRDAAAQGTEEMPPAMQSHQNWQWPSGKTAGSAVAFPAKLRLRPLMCVGAACCGSSCAGPCSDYSPAMSLPQSYAPDPVPHGFAVAPEQPPEIPAGYSESMGSDESIRGSALINWPAASKTWTRHRQDGMLSRSASKDSAPPPLEDKGKQSISQDGARPCDASPHFRRRRSWPKSAEAIRRMF